MKMTNRERKELALAKAAVFQKLAAAPGRRLRRSQLTMAFSGRRCADQLWDAVSALEDEGKLEIEEYKPEGGGRPGLIYHLVRRI